MAVNAHGKLWTGSHSGSVRIWSDADVPDGASTCGTSAVRPGNKRAHSNVNAFAYDPEGDRMWTCASSC